MKLSDLVKELQAIEAKHGDLDVVIESPTHSWEPEPTVRTSKNPRGYKFVLLNP